MARRYTVLIADRSSGVVRRLTINLRVVALVIAAAVTLPVLIALGARWGDTLERRQLQVMNNALQIENGNYRETTGELTTQIQSLENVIDELGSRSALDPAQAKAMSKLPAVVKARAAGGKEVPRPSVTANVIEAWRTRPS